MTPLRLLARRLRFLFRRGAAEREMAEEMRFHLEMRTEDGLAGGLPADEARHAANRKFGNLGMVQAKSRDQFVFQWLEQLLQDVSYSARTLRKNKGYSIVALLTLGLGIGVNTTAFTVLNRLLLRPAPFADTRRLVHIRATSADGSEGSVSPGDFFDLRAQNTALDHVSAYYVSWLSTLAEPGQAAIRCDSISATADFFTALGIQPVMLGRAFTDQDEARHENIALLSHSFWVKHYRADPRVLGRILRTDGGFQYTIVGVMAAALDDPTLFVGTTDGLAFCTLMSGMDPRYRDRGWNSVVARLKPGVTAQRAQAELAALARRLAHDFPKSNTGRGFKTVPFPTRAMDEMGGRLVWLVMGLSGVVLLVACVNLANLQLVRTTARNNELGIRLALGCTRARLIRMLLTESMMISTAGGALGLLLAQWSNRYLAAYWKVDMPLNFRVIGFTCVVSAAAGALFGTMPALFASREQVNASIKQGARGTTPDRYRHRLRQALIVVELAMALMLLAGAGYFVRGIQRITQRDLGWRPEGVLIGYLALDHDHYGEVRDPRSVVFGDRLISEMASLPGVDAVALSNDNVFGANPINFEIEGRPPYERDVLASIETPSPGYFGAYGIRLLEGREFRDTDRPGTPKVAIISANMAQRYWPGESAIGKRIGTEDPAHQDWAEVVGVVGNILHDLEWDPRRSRYAIYYPWAQNSFRYLAVTLHSSGDPEALKEEVRKTFGRIEPNIAFSFLGAADELMAQDLMQYTVARRMLVQVAGLGLLLAAVGIYGVVANLAAERTKEIGIRMALGAQPRDVIWLFLGNGVRLALIGTGLGLAGAFGLNKALGHLLSDFPGNDPWVVGSVGIVLITVTLVACWLPARGATRVNPMDALRAD